MLVYAGTGVAAWVMSALLFDVVDGHEKNDDK